MNSTATHWSATWIAIRVLMTKLIPYVQYSVIWYALLTSKRVWPALGSLL